MNVYVSFEDQKKQDANLNIKAMATQFGINLGVSVAVILAFNFLRPRNTLVYAAKYKFSTARYNSQFAKYQYHEKIWSDSL